MRSTLKLTSALASALVLLAATTLPVLAQAPTEEVIVPGPYTVTKTHTGPTRTTTITMAQAVPYSDLDLKTGQGVTRLQGRVRQAAAGVCHEMNRHYPIPAYSGVTVNDNCVNTAVRQAMAQVEGIAVVPRTVAQAQAPVVAQVQVTTAVPRS